MMSQRELIAPRGSLGSALLDPLQHVAVRTEQQRAVNTGLSEVPREV